MTVDRCGEVLFGEVEHARGGSCYGTARHRHDPLRRTRRAMRDARGHLVSLFLLLHESRGAGTHFDQEKAASTYLNGGPASQLTSE